MSKATKENITRLLELSGYTHEKLGKVCNVQRSTVSHWVAGKSEPRMGAVQRMARHFGIDETCITNPNGMAYVSKTPDGHYRDDRDRRVRDALMLLLSSDDVGDGVLSQLTKTAMSYRTSADSGLSQDELDLVTIYRRLNDSGRELARKMVSALDRSGDYGTD